MPGDIRPRWDPGALIPVLLPQPGTHEAARAQLGQSSPAGFGGSPVSRSYWGRRGEGGWRRLRHPGLGEGWVSGSLQNGGGAQGPGGTPKPCWGLRAWGKEVPALRLSQRPKTPQLGLGVEQGDASARERPWGLPTPGWAWSDP